MVTQVVRKSILFGILLCLSWTAIAAEWSGRDIFPLMGWVGPPFDKELLNHYHAAGFTYVPMPPDEAWAPAIEVLQKADMQALTVLPDGPQSNLIVAANFGTAKPNGAGWFVGHEVAAPNAGSYIPVLESLEESDPDRIKFLTLLTSRSGVEWRERLPELAEAGMSAFAFHHFFMPNTGDTDEAAMFSLLEMGRDLTKAYDVDVWGMVQVTPFDDYRRTSESDIRVQAYSQLACGARGLVFFSFWDPLNVDTYERWGPAMLNAETRESEYGYQMVRLLNHELRILTPQLNELSHKASYFFGTVPVPEHELPNGETPFIRIDGQHGLVGFFEDEEKATWAFLVNRRHAPAGAAMTMKSTFLVFVDDAVKGITEIDRYTGYEKPVPIENGRFQITLPGGTGSLLRLEIGTDEGQGSQAGN